MDGGRRPSLRDEIYIARDLIVHYISAMTSRDPTQPADDDIGPLSLDRQLCFALYSTSLAMTKVYRPLLEPLGLTYPQYLAMLVLWEEDGSTVSGLGERLMLDSGTLTPLVKRLEGAGFVERRRDADAERRVRLHLTRRGRALRRRAEAVPELAARATGCDIDELMRLKRWLERLRDDIRRRAAA